MIRRISAAFAFATGLAAASTQALAQTSQVSRDIDRGIEAEVTYQMASSALAVATLCGGSSDWQNYDRDALLADYRSTRDLLEKQAPGRRIFAEFETFRLLQSLNDISITAGPDRALKMCTSLAPALLSKYRSRP